MVRKSIQKLATELLQKPDGEYYLINTFENIFWNCYPKGIVLMKISKKGNCDIRKLKKILFDNMKKVVIADKEHFEEYFLVDGYIASNNKNVLVKYSELSNTWQTIKTI